MNTFKRIVFGLLLSFSVAIPALWAATYTVQKLVVTDNVKVDTLQSNTGTDTVTIVGLKDSVTKKHVHSGTANYVPKWNGTAYVDGAMFDSGGNIGIGTINPKALLELSAQSVAAGLIITGYGGVAAGTSYFVGREARGTLESPSASQANDSLLIFGGRGYGATGFSAINKAAITFHAAENWTDSSQGAYITFGTTPIGSTTRAERMRILDNGNVGIGTTAPGVSTLAGRTYLTIRGSTLGGVLELVGAQADADNATTGIVQFTDENSTDTDKRIAVILSSLSGTTSNNRGGALRFYTKEDAGILGERLKITSTGKVIVYDLTASKMVATDGSKQLMSSTFTDTQMRTRHLRFVILDAATAVDTTICLIPKTESAITITNVEITCDADPATEIVGDVKWADAFIGLANAAVINDFDTTAGVRSDSTITSAAVAASKCVYIQFDATPAAAPKEISADITYVIN